MSSLDLINPVTQSSSQLSSSSVLNLPWDTINEASAFYSVNNSANGSAIAALQTRSVCVGLNHDA